MIPRTAVLAATAALAAAALAGCGGTTGHASADQRAAASARLDADDLPGRWLATPNGGTLNCPALAAAVGTERAASDQFIGQPGSADDVVFVFPNALAAKVRMRAVLSDQGRRCIGREMWDGPTAAVRSAPLAVNRIGDDVHAARFQLPAGTQTLYDALDVVVVLVGRGVVIVEVGADPARLDAGLRTAVVAAAVRKLRAELDG